MKRNQKTNERRTLRKCTGESACLCTQMSGSNLSEGNWCGQSIFSNTMKLKNSNIKCKKVTKTY